MAETAQKRVTRRPTKQTARASSRRPRRRVASRTRRQTSDIGALEDVIRSLESRIAQLTSGQAIRSTVSGATDQMGSVVSRASHQVGDMVADTLTDVAGRLLSGSTNVTGAARAGAGAMQRIGNELERRPFMTVAIALGIGFLAGMAGRRE